MGLPQRCRADAAEDQDGARYASCRRDGLIISQKAGRVLGVKAGETVRVEVLQDKRPVVDVPVVDLLDDITGLNAYMDIEALNRLDARRAADERRDADDRPAVSAGHLPRAEGNAAGGQRHDPAGVGRQLPATRSPRTCCTCG